MMLLMLRPLLLPHTLLLLLLMTKSQRLSRLQLFLLPLPVAAGLMLLMLALLQSLLCMLLPHAMCRCESPRRCVNGVAP